jgi:hypothetical protein
MKFVGSKDKLSSRIVCVRQTRAFENWHAAFVCRFFSPHVRHHWFLDLLLALTPTISPPFVDFSFRHPSDTIANPKLHLTAPRSGCTSSLHTLVLNRNNIGNDGARYLAAVLAQKCVTLGLNCYPKFILTPIRHSTQKQSNSTLTPKPKPNLKDFRCESFLLLDAALQAKA